MCDDYKATILQQEEQEFTPEELEFLKLQEEGERVYREYLSKT